MQTNGLISGSDGGQSWTGCWTCSCGLLVAAALVLVLVVCLGVSLWYGRAVGWVVYVLVLFFAVCALACVVAWFCSAGVSGGAGAGLECVCWLWSLVSGAIRLTLVDQPFCAMSGSLGAKVDALQVSLVSFLGMAGDVGG